jgi:hypothetical protein
LSTKQCFMKIQSDGVQQDSDSISGPKFCSNPKGNGKYYNQGILTEGEDSVQLTSLH